MQGGVSNLQSSVDECHDAHQGGMGDGDRDVDMSEAIVLHRAEHVLLHFFFSSRRRHTRLQGDWSSDVCSSDLTSPTAHSSATSTGFGPAARRFDSSSAVALQPRSTIGSVPYTVFSCASAVSTGTPGFSLAHTLSASLRSVGSITSGR